MFKTQEKMIKYCKTKNKITEMTLSKSSLGKIDTCNLDIGLEHVIVQETNIGNEASLTTTTYIVPDTVRTPPRENASLSEVLSYLNINP